MGHAAVRDRSHCIRPIEIAESSLDFDRTRKGSLNARAAVPDYWIVNLVEGAVEIYRDPGPDASSVFGWWDRSLARLGPPALVRPLAWSGESIAVADLLP